MVESDQRKGAKGPEDGGVGKTGKRALANDLGLEEDFPDEVTDALAEGEEAEVRIFFRLEDFAEDGAKATPEKCSRSCGKPGEEQLLKEGEVLRSGQGWEGRNHRRTKERYRIGLGSVVLSLVLYAGMGAEPEAVTVIKAIRRLP